MKKKPNNNLIRSATALFLVLCLFCTGGCITISPGKDPVNNLPTQEPAVSVSQDASLPQESSSVQDASDLSETVAESSGSEALFPTIPSEAVSASEENESDPTDTTDFEIDWENWTKKEKPLKDDNVLTKEEFEKMAEANPQMADLMEFIGPYIDFFGFAYDAEQDIFYSTKYPVQRIFGFNTLYDTGASPFGMYYQTKRIRFDHQGKEWMVQLWKGQYGMTVGGEVGVYYRDNSKLLKHFEAVEDEDMVMMGFQLCKNNIPYLERGPEKHWWLTGFRILDVAVPTQLSMVFYFDWEDPGLADAFETGLRKILLSDIVYRRDGTQFWMSWTL